MPKFYELTYYLSEKEYTVRFPKARGPSRLQSVLLYRDGHYDKDVTLEVRRYMGPSNNFHGIPTTPSFLGYGENGMKLHFVLFGDENRKIFGPTDVIAL